MISKKAWIFQAFCFLASFGNNESPHQAVISTEVTRNGESVFLLKIHFRPTY